jgi:hypothetical protein
MSISEHVVLVKDTATCLHCGQEYKISMPCPITVLSAICEAFTADHRRCSPDPAVAAGRAEKLEKSFQNPYAWRHGPDIGLSSLTIWHAIIDGAPGHDPHVPQDPADFGRCYRMVKAFGWRDKLDRVSTIFPPFKPIVDAWDELCALYEEELPSGQAPKLYERMKELRT